MAILPIRVDTFNGVRQVDQLSRSIRNLETNSNRATRATSSLSTGFKALATGALAYIAIDQLTTSVLNLGKAFVTTADDMSLINSRLSLVTSGTEELAIAQSELLKISNDARVGLKATSDLYSQLGRSTQALGISQAELLDVTETISQTLTISGASAMSANAALFQLSQGFSAGALRGEELNSVLEQTPRLAQAIADGLGVSIGQLRELGSQGALTTQTVLDSLKSQAEAVNEEFGGIAVTAQSGYTVLQNQIDSTVGKLDQQHKITETIGNTFIALSKTVDTLLITAFEELTGEAVDFGEFTVTAVTGIIESMGTLYDVAESIGDIFNGLGASARIAFWGIVAVVSTVADTIASTFEGMLNGVISGINTIIGYANSTGLVSFGSIDPVKLTGGSAQNAQFASEKLAVAQADFQTASDDLVNISTIGRDTASSMIKSFTTAFAELRERETAGGGGATATSLADFMPEDTKKAIEETKETLEDTKKPIVLITDSLEDTKKAFEDINETIFEDKDSTYQVITQATDSTKDYNSTIDDLSSTMQTATQELERFTVQFTDTFINSIQNNANQLRQIGEQTAFNTVSYSQALAEAVSARDLLIANPLNVGVGELYTQAYNQFVTSATDFLDPSNFATLEEFRFAQATVGTQAQQFESTATAGADVLDSMNSLLGELNKAFEDGILTAEEKGVIAGVATDINDKNDLLLGQKSTIVSTVDGLYKGEEVKISNQITGYATDSNISSQKYFDNSLLMKDATFSDNGLTGSQLTDAGLYTGENISIDNTGFNQNNFTDNGLTNTQLTDQGLYTGDDINATVNTVDVSGLMQNSTFTDNGLTNSQLENQGLYTGGNIGVTETNPISGFAKDSTFTTTDGLKVDNQVADVSNLMKDATFSDNGLTSTELTSAGLYTGGNIGVTETSPISGFAKDSTFTTQNGLKVDNKVADTSSLMQNSTFVAPFDAVKIKKSDDTIIDPYTGGDINAEVNTVDISTLATSQDLGIVDGAVSGTDGLTQSIQATTTSVNGANGLDESIKATTTSVSGTGGLKESVDTVSTSISGRNNSLYASVQTLDTSLGNTGINGSLTTINTSLTGAGGVKDSIGKVSTALSGTDENTVTSAISTVSGDLISSLTGADNSVDSALKTIQTSLGTDGVDGKLTIINTSLTGKNGLNESVKLVTSSIDGTGDNTVTKSIANIVTNLTGDNSVKSSLDLIQGVLGTDENNINKSLGLVKDEIQGTNSITSALGLVNDLLDDNTKDSTVGSFTSILGALNSTLQIATGTDEIISVNVGNESISVSDANSSNIYNALGGKSTNGTTIANLKIKEIDRKAEILYTTSKGRAITSTTGVSAFLQSGETVTATSATGGGTDTYSYFAKGGFTGSGFGMPDETGFKVAGITHEDEWVAPKWMIQQNPMIFNDLESIRQRGSFAQGGFTSPTPNFNVNATLGSNVLDSVDRRLGTLERIFLQVTQGGDIMRVELAQ